MELNQVSYHYPQQKMLLNQITATVPEDQILSIIGPNGAGKSTLLKLLAGLIQPTSGKVLLNDQPISNFSRKTLATKVAVVSQQNDIFDDMKVIDIVKTGRLAHHNLLATIDDSEVADYITATNLAELAQYLLLDEPTTYLDIHYQAELMTILKRLHEQQQMTIIMVLHDINQAFRISDQLWLVKDGQLVKQGRPADCYDQQLLEQIFGTNIQIVDVPNYGRYIVEIADAQPNFAE